MTTPMTERERAALVPVARVTGDDDGCHVWPCTRDGFPIYEGMTIWDRNGDPYKIATVHVDIGTHRLAMTVCDERNPLHLMVWWNCYSSLAAANAAHDGGGK